MVRVWWMLVLGGVLLPQVGCRCCGGCLDHYAQFVDHFQDTQILFDSWYCPKCDISRAGKPDWCTPCHRWLCPCRCVNGSYDRYDACWQYPPSHPYLFPGQSIIPGQVGGAPKAELPPDPSEVLYERDPAAAEDAPRLPPAPLPEAPAGSAPQTAPPGDPQPPPPALPTPDAARVPPLRRPNEVEPSGWLPRWESTVPWVRVAEPSAAGEGVRPASALPTP